MDAHGKDAFLEVRMAEPYLFTVSLSALNERILMLPESRDWVCYTSTLFPALETVPGP